MTVEDYLKKDDTYISTSWIGNLLYGHEYRLQRRAYEEGVRKGWHNGIKSQETSYKIPHNMELPINEYKDIMSLLSAFGYQFVYTTAPIMPDNIYKGSVMPGLNICRNLDARNAGVVVSDEVRQKVFTLLKQYSDPRLWNH